MDIEPYSDPEGRKRGERESKVGLRGIYCSQFTCAALII